MGMTPEEAAQVLHDTSAYSEELTTRAHGLTNMVWGLAIGGLFMAYAAAGPVLDDTAPWAYSILWVPFIAAGGALTTAIWTTHAVSTRTEPETARGLLMMAGFTVLFLALMGAIVWILTQAMAVAWSFNTAMILVTGVFGLILVAVGKWQGHGPSVPMLIANFGIIAAAVIIGLNDPGENMAGFLGSFIAGGAWFTGGLVTAMRG